jgi:transcriptional regulator with XRE-family HTH domain
MDLGLRQSDVADRIGVWTSTVNYWEKNRFNPEVQYVPKVVAFLGYDPFEPPPASLPLQLRAARVAAGLTRRQLAARLGVHPGTVAEWERGDVQPLESSVEWLRALLGISGGQPT